MIELPEDARVRHIPPGSFERHFRSKYRSPLRKLGYFALREGLRATVRKARSKRTERAIERAQGVLVASFELAGRPRIGVGRALHDRPRLDPRLVFENPARLLADAVELTPRALELAESYLPVPSCPFPEELVDEIVRANPALARSKPPAPADAAHPALSESAPARAPRPSALSQSGVYLIGFGGYVREYVMPHVRRDARAAADYKADLIRRFARPGIPVFSDTAPLLEQIAGDQRPLVIISSYHSDHASDALRVLEANPQACVFVEKPAAVLPADADRLAQLRGSGAWIDVGYNRRFAPLTAALRAELARLPRPWSLAMAVKELSIPPSHWYHWANQGTRISGNACHWIDLAHFLVASPAMEIESTGFGDEVALILRFPDGSHAALTMTERGEDLYGVTERIRVQAGDCTVDLDDFRRITVNRGASSRTVARMRRDKGHDAMYRSLLERWRAARPPVYPVGDLVDVSRATWAAAELHREGTPGIRALTPSGGGRFA